jgi:multicomponent Na+:H+ antiporter subunit G
MTVLAVALIVSGVFFLMVSSIGLLRLPDFYTRNHAVGKSETLGAMLVLSGLAVYNGWALSTVKVLLIALFVLIANPSATHAIARAALRCGLEPWTKERKQTGDGRDSEEKSIQKGVNLSKHDLAD